MPDLAVLLIAALWFALTAARVYRLARFYQIDEYKSNRFGRWWLSKPERILPPRSLPVMLGAAVFSVLFSEGGPLLPTLIFLAASVLATYPAPDREVKKKFVATPRARRILAAAFVIPVLLALIAFALIVSFSDDY